MLLSQSPHAEGKAETGWTGEQGAQSTLCGNKSASADNRLQSEMAAFGERNPSRRRRNRMRPGMNGGSLVSARTDNRSESSATGRRRKIPEAWTIVLTRAMAKGFQYSKVNNVIVTAVRY